MSRSFTVTRETSRFPWFLPPEREELPAQAYRVAGKVQAITQLVFLVGNWAALPDVTPLGFRNDVYRESLWVTSPLLVSIIALGLALWRLDLSIRVARAFTYLTIFATVSAVLFLAWTRGTVHSYLPTILMLCIVGYRAGLDFRMGLFAFLYSWLGLWTIVLLEWASVLTPAPVLITPVVVLPTERLASMHAISVGFVATFIVINATAIRLQYKNTALRVLRARVLSEGGARVGRHSGSTLAERYVVGTLLGSGATGEVYAAYDEREKRDVALKLLHPHVCENATVLARFEREARVTSALGSPHIVAMHGLEHTEEGPLLVLEYMRGESLAQRLEQRTTLPLSEVAEMVRQAALGLSAAHRAGVVHRDLKPENIFLSEEGVGGAPYCLKLLDFGASKVHGAITQLTHEHGLIGTPLYMAPEQALAAQAVIGPQTDLFALAAVAYRMLVGVAPFRADTVPQLLYRICEEAPPRPSAVGRGIPEDVDLVLLRALCKEPRFRQPDVETFARELREAVLGKLSAEARRESRGLLMRGAAGRVVRGQPQDEKPAPGWLTTIDR